MYRNEDGDGRSHVSAVAVPEAQPIDEADLEADSADADLAPAQPVEAEAPASPAARQTPNEAAPAAPVGKDRPQRGSRRKLVLGVVAVLAAGVAAWFGYNYITVGRFTVSTDDAYVQAYNTTLAAKVAGYLASVPVTDNTYVHTGDVIATIDDGDYRLAVDSARGKVATQEATVARIAHQITAQEAAVEQARTQLVAAQAGSRRMELELNRQNLLVARDASSRQLQEQALAKAERDLSFTVIRAPIDGVIGNRAVQTGDYVQTGQRLASLVPLAEVYVTANFKETQVARLRPGQPVSIAVDALPEHTIQGTVESFSPASGAVFSLLPPDNATGNFTKIVQRLPVRIHVPLDIAREGLLRPGMSVVVSVNTKSSAVADNGKPLQTQSASAR